MPRHLRACGLRALLVGLAFAALLAVAAPPAAQAVHGIPAKLEPERTRRALEAVAANRQASEQLARLRRDFGPLRVEAHPSPSGENVALDYYTKRDELAYELYVNGTTYAIERGTLYDVAEQRRRPADKSALARLQQWPLFLALTLLVVAVLVDWRRPLRIHTLDVVALAVGGASFPLAGDSLLYNRQFRPDELRATSIAATLFLLWFTVRGCLRFFRSRAADDEREPATRARAGRLVWIALALALVLLAGRWTANLLDPRAFDISQANYVGARTMLEGRYPYGDRAFDVVRGGDTYGPVDYVLYMPASLAVEHLDVRWERAVALTTIAADALVAVLLFLLARRLAGMRGAALALVAWAASPIAIGSVLVNPNDQLVALLVLAAVLARSQLARGGFVALAAWIKFAPFAVAGVLAYRQRRVRPILAYVAGGVLVSLPMAVYILANDPLQFWESTVAFQAARQGIFSVWGSIPLPGIGVVRVLVAALLVASLFVPAARTRTSQLWGVVAMAAAVQLPLSHLGLPYMVWLLPVLVALLAAERLRQRQELPGLDSNQ